MNRLSASQKNEASRTGDRYLGRPQALRILNPNGVPGNSNETWDISPPSHVAMPRQDDDHYSVPSSRISVSSTTTSPPGREKWVVPTIPHDLMTDVAHHYAQNHQNEVQSSDSYDSFSLGSARVNPKPTEPFKFFMEEMKHQLKKEHPELLVRDIKKILTDRWKTMSAADKVKYQRMSRLEIVEAKFSHAPPLQQHTEIAPFSDKNHDHTIAAVPDISNAPVAPSIVHFGSGLAARSIKKPRSAYAFYTSHAHREIAAKNPTLSLAERMRLIGPSWKALPDSEKSKFQRLAKEERDRFDSELLANPSIEVTSRRGEKRKASRDDAISISSKRTNFKGVGLFPISHHSAPTSVAATASHQRKNESSSHSESASAALFDTTSGSASQTIPYERVPLAAHASASDVFNSIIKSSSPSATDLPLNRERATSSNGQIVPDCSCSNPHSDGHVLKTCNGKFSGISIGDLVMQAAANTKRSTDQLRESAVIPPAISGPKANSVGPPTIGELVMRLASSVGSPTSVQAMNASEGGSAIVTTQDYDDVSKTGSLMSKSWSVRLSEKLNEGEQQALGEGTGDQNVEMLSCGL
ncbi:hypothetical protein BJ742DRAFT_842913 [Cladochytrium replicatum]|nr:hypothetical protein BJ742DRAFT_842913 [Cladochytrium replicatum]